VIGALRRREQKVDLSDAIMQAPDTDILQPAFHRRRFGEILPIGADGVGIEVYTTYDFGTGCACAVATAAPAAKNIQCFHGFHFQIRCLITRLPGRLGI
jgi:hypothetical protein